MRRAEHVNTARCGLLMNRAEAAAIWILRILKTNARTLSRTKKAEPCGVETRQLSATKVTKMKQHNSTQGTPRIGSGDLLGCAWLTLVISITNLVSFFMAISNRQDDVITTTISSERLLVSGQSALKCINVVLLLGVTPLNRP